MELEAKNFAIVRKPKGHNIMTISRQGLKAARFAALQVAVFGTPFREN